jgi:hypothetical protein
MDTRVPKTWGYGHARPPNMGFQTCDLGGKLWTPNLCSGGGVIGSLGGHDQRKSRRRRAAQGQEIPGNHGSISNLHFFHECFD